MQEPGAWASRSYGAGTTTAKLHISTVASRLSDLPVLGRDPLFPAVSINEFKHFPAQQLEPLLVLHLCLINEIASNLNIS